MCLIQINDNDDDDDGGHFENSRLVALVLTATSPQPLSSSAEIL